MRSTEDGSFEFRRVGPGSYWISASVEERSGLVPVNVVNSSVDGISISFKAGATISGRVRFESGEPAPSVPLQSVQHGPPPMGAYLTPYSGDRQPAPPWLPSPVFSPMEAGGTFRVSNLMPGEYLFSFPGQFVKEARFGGTDILNQPLRFAGSETSTLDVVLSSKLGAIDGKVLGGTHVVLVPDQRERVFNFRAVTADTSGRFSIQQIIPGDYKLFAWESLEPYGYFDPELLRRSEKRGIRVHVGESSRQSVDLRAIPSP